MSDGENTRPLNFTAHALRQMKRRRITEEQVYRTIEFGKPKPHPNPHRVRYRRWPITAVVDVFDGSVITVYLPHDLRWW